MNKNLVLIGATLATLIIIPLAIWGIVSFSEQGTEHVKLVIVPADATVKIGDKEYKGEKSIRLQPGEYPVTVSKEGFETVNQKLLIKEGKEATHISLLLAVSPEALKWAKDNQSAYRAAEGAAGTLAIQQGEEFIDKYPITKWLPLQKATYVIGYKQPEADKLIITITATEGYREAALDELRKKGTDPSDYVIEFNNYRNPFNV